MYVRWKRRPIKKRNISDPNPHQLAAYLVESRRVDGKPRQRTVAYLGGISERFLGEPAHRHWFWKDLAQRLDTLALPQSERETIEAALARAVARLTAEEEEQIGQRVRELEARGGLRR
jgi:hypothetical protein